MTYFLAFTTMVRMFLRDLRSRAAAGTPSGSNAARTPSLPSMRSLPLQTATGTDVIVLTFPDGRDVRNLADLSEWLQMIENDETTPQEHKHLAYVLANRIRAKFN